MGLGSCRQLAMRLFCAAGGSPRRSNSVHAEQRLRVALSLGFGFWSDPSLCGFCAAGGSQASQQLIAEQQATIQALRDRIKELEATVARTSDLEGKVARLQWCLDHEISMRVRLESMRDEAVSRQPRAG